MKRKVYVVTENPYLWQKIYLILKYEREISLANASEIVRASVVDGARANAGEAVRELCLWDVDTVGDAPLGAVTLSRGEGAMLRVPFGDGELITLLDSLDGEGVPRLGLSGRLATLDGEEIKLTEVEAALLGRLVLAGGFVSRAELMRDVWGGGADGGVLNVYIHYLREKLERRGEKVILSSRSEGYRINEKYLNGGRENA